LFVDFSGSQSLSNEMDRIRFPEPLRKLFEPNRYKILYGGRGGAKSWGVARALLIIGAERPIRVLCAREFQSSISDSVHKLLSDQIELMGYGPGQKNFYEIEKATIKGRNGTEFVFAGIRHNVGRIKSYEGVDIVWVEEAENVSRNSWEVLIPTIRKSGSEIWLTFNPALESDETYQRFVVNPPPGALLLKLNWIDNPWFGGELERERILLKQRDPDAYLNVYEGQPRHTLDGAIYARELRQAAESGRITRVPYDATKPVHTFWDLGWFDATSIWFAQAVGLEYRVIDFCQVTQTAIPEIVKELQKRGYVYGIDYLPHDGRAKSLSGAGRSIEQMLRALGRTVHVQPPASVSDGINAVRSVFPNCWFDEAKCSDGLQALRHYRYKVDPDTGQFSKEPLHDEHSHAADAFRGLAMSLVAKTPQRPKVYERPNYGSTATGWMG
jgi:phage terminase large subunit